MKIIILGAGQVGTSVAANLVNEDNDITLVDNNPAILQLISERYDLRTITGVASHPSVLAQAGAKDADMILAVTNSDEVNMVACQVAYTLFHTPTKIARIREIEYLNNASLFAQEALPVDVLISPEQLVTDYIERLISHPGALQVVDFADGKAQMVALRASRNGVLAGNSLRELRNLLTDIEYKIFIIFRKGKAIIPNGDTMVETDDEIFFISSQKSIRQLLQVIRNNEKPYKSIMIAGGGNIGLRLAESLEGRYKVKLLELDPAKARFASETLKNTVVLNGDAADEDLLIEEDIDRTDVYCALTNADEANIISSMLAKRLGARKVMALINRAAYVDLVQSNTIDIAISPQQATIGSLLAHVRKGDVVVVHALRRGAAEAIEAIAHGNESSSKVVGKAIKDIDLPPSTTIGAIVRGDDVLMATKKTIIEAEDHIILIVSDKKYVAEVEALFQVGITFL
ncbi:MAG: Trk system potassium transporter TrkA [Proteobacteria bacterium]|nr:Trk system potassium transporter TrkA [Pseudomonadota bacterium]NOG60223.1 Trk system potassium transporter TrkA [Pseudomonadota bacterium]